MRVCGVEIDNVGYTILGDEGEDLLGEQFVLGQFLQPKKIRNVLCRPEASLSFRDIMDKGKIALFNLPDGLLGEQNAQLLGQLVVSNFQIAILSRANIPQKKRRRFYLYVDEFQTFTSTANASYDKILERSRKYRLALTLAHQQTGQIPDNLLHQIFGNVSTMISFEVSGRDGKKLSPEFLWDDPERGIQPLPPIEFSKLNIGQAYIKLGKRAFQVAITPPLGEGDPERAMAIIERSHIKATPPITQKHPAQSSVHGDGAPPPPQDSMFEDVDPDEIF